MLQIQRVTADPRQQQTLVLPNGKSFTISMYYVPMQYGWFFTNITYQDFVVNSIRITNNGNMLYQFQNKIPFGLACFSKTGREPMLQEDFASGASSLYILTEADCEAYRDYIQGGAIPA